MSVEASGQFRLIAVEEGVQVRDQSCCNPFSARRDREHGLGRQQFAYPLLSPTLPLPLFICLLREDDRLGFIAAGSHPTRAFWAVSWYHFWLERKQNGGTVWVRTPLANWKMMVQTYGYALDVPEQRLIHNRMSIAPFL